jgi:predicted dienelactone hydrolase
MYRSISANPVFMTTALAAFFVLPALPALAQDKIEVPRADGAQTPMRVYTPKSPGCAPLAIISHGAGGSENGYRYLAEGLQGQGWLAIVVGHKESGPEVLRHEVFTHGLKNGLTQMVTNPTAYRDRFMDIDAADKWATARCKPPYSVLLGHSMGAYTVMLEAGAKNNLGLTPPPSAHNFDAFVALSPPGPDQVFPADAWADIHKPMLIITGTKDRALSGGWQSRTIPYQDLPAGCHWLGVVEDATHMNFAGIGIAADKADSLTLSLIYAFLHGARTGSCMLPPTTSGITVQAK